MCWHVQLSSFPFLATDIQFYHFNPTLQCLFSPEKKTPHTIPLMKKYVMWVKNRFLKASFYCGLFGLPQMYGASQNYSFLSVLSRYNHKPHCIFVAFCVADQHKYNKQWSRRKKGHVVFKLAFKLKWRSVRCFFFFLGCMCQICRSKKHGFFEKTAILNKQDDFTDSQLD